MSRVLLIEDDASVRDALALGLRRQGHEVRTAASGEAGLEQARREPPEIVVLDLMLPGIDGFEVCRRLRRDRPTPVIMLTARGDDVDTVLGLEAGADDYVIKPAQSRVLDARIRAVLRRTDAPGPEPVREVHGDLVLDRAALTVTKNGAPLPLAPGDLRLLLELATAPGRVFSREQLLESVWGLGRRDDIRLVDAGVNRLRTNIEDSPAAPRYIQAVRGFGYRFGPL
ncbi:response regulator transcription factor [Kitasatospora aureofaciens]|uniref:response regulator transcription factor n=1 Tax=Kitasatospora aureofaciens TaxID=1894 RepID=UPI001C43E78B|nr:response regulator transcription factor [Kitasatospora aureofaciens]MBV6698954.1 response regulator transcription factor [Kitasatospora aureofaciens]